MRERVDALGVSEPEIQRSGADQIEVNLPGRRRTPSAPLKQVGSTAQLFFYDWEAERPRRELQDQPDTEINGGQQPVTGLYNAVKRAAKCDIPVREERRQAAAEPALLRVRQGHARSRSPTAVPRPSRAPRRSTG